MPRQDTYVVRVKLRNSGSQELTIHVQASDPYEAERKARKTHPNIEVVEDVRKL